jgi:rod shape-determining protein MreD
MSLSPQSVIRCSLVVFFAVLIQVTCIERIHVIGTAPDLLPLVVAAVAIYAGSVPGAVVGFGTGLLLDLMIGVHIGGTSLTLTAVGYGVGRYRELRDPAHGLLPIPVGAAATAGYAVGSAAVGFMLSIDASVSLVVLREMIVLILLNTLLALPVFALVRRVLRSALLVDPLERRRRRRGPSETGPIGLRGLGIGNR